MDLGHDDTAAIAQGMAAVGGGGTLVFPAGTCHTHTQILKGQSPIGLGPDSFILGMPGEDIFQGPDPSQGPGYNQGAAHIHDLTFLVDGRIDATLPWQSINDSGTTAHAAMYRPVATLSGVSSNPLAPGWFIGGYNGVANNHGRLRGDVRAHERDRALGWANRRLPLPGLGIYGHGELDGGELHQLNCADLVQRSSRRSNE